MTTFTLVVQRVGTDFCINFGVFCSVGLIQWELSHASRRVCCYSVGEKQDYHTASAFRLPPCLQRLHNVNLELVVVFWEFVAQTRRILSVFIPKQLSRVKLLAQLPTKCCFKSTNFPSLLSRFSSYSFISTSNNPLSLNQIVGYLNRSINCLAGLLQSTLFPCLHFHLVYPVLSTSIHSHLHLQACTLFFAYISSCTFLILFSLSSPLPCWLFIRHTSSDLLLELELVIFETDLRYLTPHLQTSPCALRPTKSPLVIWVGCIQNFNQKIQQKKRLLSKHFLHYLKINFLHTIIIVMIFQPPLGLARGFPNWGIIFSLCDLVHSPITLPLPTAAAPLPLLFYSYRPFAAAQPTLYFPSTTLCQLADPFPYSLSCTNRSFPTDCCWCKTQDELRKPLSEISDTTLPS
ncbi:hypothetical protein VP01_17g9 [Puccinia sorghi]|uniref:Uncharacterized protein n=1 Tax=Puccinia sorghi TaxID=27349 RepID=A0A0L6VEW9_9BASI|nr:hypothetical protein VP01_17g9 [Puccinia sorghi]